MNRFNPILVSHTDVIRELERELDTRKKVYPRWKLEGKIKSLIADHRIACIEKAIKLLKESQTQQKKLF